MTTLPATYNQEAMYRFLSSLPFRSLVVILKGLWSDLRKKGVPVRQYNYSKRTIALIHTVLDHKGIYKSSSIGTLKIIRQPAAANICREKVVQYCSRTVRRKQTTFRGNDAYRGKFNAMTRKGEPVYCEMKYKVLYTVSYWDRDWNMCVKKVKAVSIDGAMFYGRKFCLDNGYSLFSVW